MKKKIFKIIFVCFAFVFLFSFAVLPTFAYTSVNGWLDYAPNMPDMQLFYLRPNSTSKPYPRTLTGYISYNGTAISSQSDNGNSMRTYKSSDSLGYTFTTFYASELFVDFNYLPFASSANTNDDVYSLVLRLDFSTNTNDYSSNPVTVCVRYFNSSGAVVTKTFTYEFSNDGGRELNLYSILNDNTAHALVSLQIGYDFSGEAYASEKYLSGNLRISNINSWIAHNPFVNSSNNLYNYSYNAGFSDATEQLGGATADEYYQRGYQNGYNTGRTEGYAEGYNQATNDNSNVNYQNGYQAGYSAGYNAFASSVSQQLSAKYQEGYSSGYDVGFAEGEGEGYNLGYSAGYDVGYDSGVADDADRFYNEGFTAGEEVGYQAGYDVGISESIEEMGLFNYIVSSCNAIFQIPLGKTFTLGGLLAVIISIPLLLSLIKLLGA